ncbi:hypothetical protein [Sphingopyxis sp. USTB-05]|uniref:hypothetical protein n=1 Tax=Sphingopyxis sp. USTB-05 TaxID=2830667 RepID=UPI002078FBE9|nr:hypothetical protein [Sphingopyxis sp. USTB-05]USI77620.1 hypothetical protein KEC45_01505 [Sphingopyxis sp. USTB-05]
MVAIVAIFGTGSNAVWLHYEHLGELRGFSFRELVTLTTIGGLLMVITPVIALKIFEKIGGFLPIIVGCALQAIIVALYLTNPSPTIFAGCIIALNILICILLPYARMLGANLDSSGRIAAAAGGGDFLGSFAGPLFGGLFTVGLAGNGQFLWGLVSTFFVAAVLCVVAQRHTKRHARYWRHPPVEAPLFR